jgi:3',5'-cyclic AMP phosphodiesterase CpdA
LSFTLAHLSDVHLAHVQKRGILKNFKGKRVIGGLSWFLRRKAMHRMDIADAIQDSIIAAHPNHIAFTGDAVNIASWREFPAAAEWMRRFGNPDTLSFVPGNHDAYVSVPWEQGLGHFTPWMKPDRHELTADNSLFPYVRMRRTVALIGLNSALPQSYRKAGGTLGKNQLRDLRHILALLGQQGFYRVVMIHHPPLPGLCKDRKALTDANELKSVLQDAGAELVLHGHNHKSMLNWIDTKSGPVPIVGVASASLMGDNKHESAGWNSYSIKRHQCRWVTEMTGHHWNRERRLVEKSKTVILSPP